MSISLAKSMKIMERSRYTFWDVLGDIGGFHDGLILFLYFIMAPFSAKAFLNKFADSTPYLEKNKQMIRIKSNTPEAKARTDSKEYDPPKQEIKSLAGIPSTKTYGLVG